MHCDTPMLTEKAEFPIPRSSCFALNVILFIYLFVVVVVVVVVVVHFVKRGLPLKIICFLPCAGFQRRIFLTTDFCGSAENCDT